MPRLFVNPLRRLHNSIASTDARLSKDYRHKEPIRFVDVIGGSTIASTSTTSTTTVWVYEVPLAIPSGCPPPTRCVHVPSRCNLLTDTPGLRQWKQARALLLLYGTAIHVKTTTLDMADLTTKTIVARSCRRQTSLITLGHLRSCRVV